MDKDPKFEEFFGLPYTAELCSSLKQDNWYGDCTAMPYYGYPYGTDDTHSLSVFDFDRTILVQNLSICFPSSDESVDNILAEGTSLYCIIGEQYCTSLPFFLKKEQYRTTLIL